jgi:hypothetical protein
LKIRASSDNYSSIFYINRSFAAEAITTAHSSPALSRFENSQNLEMKGSAVNAK